jgi:PAS domain-containing protein
MEPPPPPKAVRHLALPAPVSGRDGAPVSGGSGAASQGIDAAQMFKCLLANSEDVFAAIAPQAGFVYLSPSVKNMLGWQPEELLG